MFKDQLEMTRMLQRKYIRQSLLKDKGISELLNEDPAISSEEAAERAAKILKYLTLFKGAVPLSQELDIKGLKTTIGAFMALLPQSKQISWNIHCEKSEEGIPNIKGLPKLKVFIKRGNSFPMALKMAIDRYCEICAQNEGNRFGTGTTVFEWSWNTEQPS